MKKHVFKRGAIFPNIFNLTCKVDFQDEDGELFTCVEQYYMYHKGIFHGQLFEADTIKSLHDPKAKNLPSCKQRNRDHARTVIICTRVYFSRSSRIRV